MTHINHLREEREKNQPNKIQTKKPERQKNPRLQLSETWLTPDMEH